MGFFKDALRASCRRCRSSRAGDSHTVEPKRLWVRPRRRPRAGCGGVCEVLTVAVELRADVLVEADADQLCQPAAAVGVLHRECSCKAAAHLVEAEHQPVEGLRAVAHHRAKGPPELRGLQPGDSRVSQQLQSEFSIGIAAVRP